MTCDEHDDLEGTVAAYLLDAADSKEGEIARAHIEGCSSCRELARRLSRAASALPLAADEVRPPERLRARILAAAEATPPGRTGKISPASVLQIARASRKRTDGKRRWGGRLPLAALAALVLVVGIAGLAVWTVQLNQQVNQQNRQLDQLNHKLGQQNQLINQGPTYHVLKGSGPLTGATGTVTSLNKEPGVIFDFNGLPNLPPGKVYELWLIDANNHASKVSVFKPDAFGAYRIALNRSLEGVKVVAVTVENGPNGVDQPTQNPPLLGPVA
jgi:Anti-sigma-K factor rskA